MKINRKWILVVSLLIGIGIADGQVNTVYTHNGDSVGYDSVCKGYAWQRLGLLDQNGRPINVPAGQIIREGNNIIGYRSANGQLEMYDLNMTGLVTAYNRIRDIQGGSLITCGHGFRHPHTDEEREGEEHEGGELQLGENIYAGFGRGTNVPDSQPYTGLVNAPANGRNIDIHLHHCWTSRDPDGQGEEISVVTSLNNFLGGGGQATGHDGLVDVYINISVIGSQNLIQRTTDAWNNTARNNNYPNYMRWSFDGMNLSNRYITLLNNIPQEAINGGITFRIMYMLEGHEQQGHILEQNEAEEPYSTIYTIVAGSSCMTRGETCRGNTPRGRNIRIDEQEYGISVTFDYVRQCGNTYIHPYSYNQWGPFPDGYRPIKLCDISTTTEYSGIVTIDATHNADPNTVRLLHYDGIWNDITTSTTQNIVTGQVTSLSPFAVVVPYAKIIKGHSLKLGGIISLIAILFVITRYRKTIITRYKK